MGPNQPDAIRFGHALPGDALCWNKAGTLHAHAAGDIAAHANTAADLQRGPSADCHTKILSLQCGAATLIYAHHV
jgi:hypothetical protein